MRILQAASTEHKPRILQAAGTNQATNSETEGKDGFIKSLLKDIARPFVRTAATIPAVVNAIKATSKGDYASAQSALNDPMDSIIGPVTPIGARTKEERIKDKAEGKPMGSFSALSKDVVGAGAEIASNLVGGGATKDLAQASIRRIIGRLVKEGAVIGGLGSGGRSLQNHDKTIGQTAFDTGLGTVGGGLFGGVLGAALNPSKVGSLLSGVDQEVLQRAYKNPQKMGQALTTVQAYPQNPFQGLAERAQDAIVGFKNFAKTSWERASDEFSKVSKGKTFDVTPKPEQLDGVLKNFQLGLNGSKVQPLHAITKFSDREVKAIDSLVSDLNKSKNLNSDGVIELLGRFDRAYNEVPLGNDGAPTAYHALIMQMKKATRKQIDSVLPDPLKAAYGQLSQYHDLMDTFGNRIVDSEGSLKQTAEQFLSNSANLNKGQLQKEIKRFSDVLGIDLTDAIQYFKDAQKLNHIIAPTGSRTQDVLRSFFVKGGGAATGALTGLASGGGFGAAAGAGIGQSLAGTLTSPAFLGNLSIASGNLRKKIVETLGKALIK